MKPEQAKALREDFPASAVGKLPKPTKKENPKGRCQECGGYHGLPAVHLDYVGHAAITDRLLSVDPEWTWEPMAYGPNGEPLVVNGGLWIWLTVCGVRRPGFGDAEGGKGPKEMIGDALRNAAMRFGVGLSLWSKEDLHASDESGAPATGAAVGAPPQSTTGTALATPTATLVTPAEAASDAQRRKLFATIRELEKTQPKAEGQLSWEDDVRQFILEKYSAESTKDISKREMGEVIDWAEKQRAEEGLPF